jgi:hypothetical protein
MKIFSCHEYDCLELRTALLFSSWLHKVDIIFKVAG